MWRPRIYDGQVSLRREGNLFAVVCRNKAEADSMERAIVRALSRIRAKRELLLKKIRGNSRYTPWLSAF